MSIDLASLEILVYPAPVLRQRAQRIETIDGTVQAVADRMLELMHQADGAGLAAPQVGLSWRMFVTRGDENQPDRVFINPRLTALQGELVLREEGCLSVPGIQVDIRRPASATISARDRDGQTFTLHGDDLPARIWQHECDHLDGVLIIDRMAPIDRIANRKMLKELEASAADR